MITVLGLGFVGLTTALGFCEKGCKVYGYEKDREKRDLLKKGIVPFHEPELDVKLRQYAGGLFQLTDDPVSAVNDSDIIFVCVGTPSGPDGDADLSQVVSAIEITVRALKRDRYRVIAIKSTVPPSTARRLLRPEIERYGWVIGSDIGLASNPEFLREGHAWEDLLQPDRIVIGEEDERGGSILEAAYKAFQAPIYRVSSETAEFSKYLSNTLLATLISFSNEQSLIAKRIGNIDITRAFRILHEDKRWVGSPANMTSYVYPGCGFGGYCLPKDTRALVQLMRNQSYEAELLSAVIKMNSIIKEAVVEEITAIAWPDESIAILGLAFKPGSNDVRESPAKDIIESLLQRGYTQLLAYDPMASAEFRSKYKLSIDYADKLEQCVERCSFLVILTASEEFLEKQELLRQKYVFDFRYMLQAKGEGPS